MSTAESIFLQFYGPFLVYSRCRSALTTSVPCNSLRKKKGAKKERWRSHWSRKCGVRVTTLDSFSFFFFFSFLFEVNERCVWLPGAGGSSCEIFLDKRHERLQVQVHRERPDLVRRDFLVQLFLSSSAVHRLAEAGSISLSTSRTTQQRTVVLWVHHMSETKSVEMCLLFVKKEGPFPSYLLPLPRLYFACFFHACFLPRK